MKLQDDSRAIVLLIIIIIISIIIMFIIIIIVIIIIIIISSLRVPEGGLKIRNSSTIVGTIFSPQSTVGRDHATKWH